MSLPLLLMIPDPSSTGSEIENPAYELWETAASLYSISLSSTVRTMSNCIYVTFKPRLEVWNTLRDMYEPRGASAQYFIAEKIFAATLSQHSSVSAYIASIQTAATDYMLAATRTHAASMAPIPSHLLVLRVLHGLPATYRIVQTTLLTSGEELTMERVKTALMQEERRLAGSGNSRDTSSALQTTTRRRGQPKTPEEKARYASWLATATCHACGKTGHIQTTCPTKAAAKADATPAPAVANVATTTGPQIVADAMMAQVPHQTKRTDSHRRWRRRHGLHCRGGKLPIHTLGH